MQHDMMSHLNITYLTTIRVSSNTTNKQRTRDSLCKIRIVLNDDFLYFYDCLVRLSVILKHMLTT